VTRSHAPGWVRDARRLYPATGSKDDRQVGPFPIDPGTALVLARHRDAMHWFTRR